MINREIWDDGNVGAFGYVAVAAGAIMAFLVCSDTVTETASGRDGIV